MKNGEPPEGKDSPERGGSPPRDCDPLASTVEGQAETPMKSRRIMIGLAGAGIAVILCLLCLMPYSQTIYALTSRNLEMVFVVTDAETGEPIPNASIDLLMEAGAWNKEVGVVHLVTDDKGRVRQVHENNSCEDIIRPFRKTVTLIDLCWASVNVSAEGYQPVEGLWLPDFKYDDKGYFREGNYQRIEFNLRLHKRGEK